MKILGICGGIRMGNWDSAASILVNGEIKAAAEEERFTRIKHAPGNLPTYAIRYCLKEADLKIQDIDCVVFPGATYHNMTSRLEEYFRFSLGHSPKIELCDHHHAHAASCFYTSGLKDALVITSDYSGDGISTTISHGVHGKLKLLKKWKFPQSLGLFYATITQQLGFEFGEDEYKVMGLASYGKSDIDLSWFLKPHIDGYKLSLTHIRKTGKKEPALSVQEALYNPLLSKRLGKRRLSSEEMTSAHQNLAASAQAQLEKTVLSLAKYWQKKTKSKNLCLAGGVAMNCVLNQKLAECGLFDSVFIPPVASDNGLALGAALVKTPGTGKLTTAAWGPSYTDDQVIKALNEVKAPVEKLPNPAVTAAEMIASGKIIGWHQGRMEYGARALGHRSILADPRLPEMKDRVNAVVKFREGFRPFAPSVILEAAGDFFVKSCESPFMTRTFDVKPSMRDKIPAVTHADGTARIQTVNRNTEPLYHQLITEVGKRTGVPMVLNTSFNIRGQPIVENPNQAISTFYGSGLDALFLGSYILRKTK